MKKHDVLALIGLLALVLYGLLVFCFAGCNEAESNPIIPTAKADSIRQEIRNAPPVSDLSRPDNLVIRLLITNPDGTLVFMDHVHIYNSSNFPWETFHGIYGIPPQYWNNTRLSINASWSGIVKNGTFKVTLFGKELLTGNCTEPGRANYGDIINTTGYLEFLINTYR